MGFDGIQNQISYLSASENGGQTRKVDQHCRIGTINYDSPVELGVAYFQSPFLLRVVSVCFLGVICFLCQGWLNLRFFLEEEDSNMSKPPGWNHPSGRRRGALRQCNQCMRQSRELARCSGPVSRQKVVLFASSQDAGCPNFVWFPYLSWELCSKIRQN